MQKRTRLLFSHLDLTILINKGFIIWSKRELFLRGENVGNPKQARLAHLACLGSQSECKIHFTLPARGFRLIDMMLLPLLIYKLTEYHGLTWKRRIPHFLNP